MFDLKVEEIREARQKLEPFLHQTPLVSSETLSRMTGHQVFLKLENLQKTGSFKPRGAITHLLSLNPEVRQGGVVTISAGNHAQGVAYAGKALGAPATVVMPEGASQAKAEAARGYGARVILHGDVAAAFKKVRDLEREEQLHFVHPFDDPKIVTGQSTVGLEIAEELPDLDLAVVGIGGGGLISGVSLAIKKLLPSAQVIGVEPTGADSMYRSRKLGQAARLEKLDTIADGLAAPFAGELNYQLVERFVDEIVLVEDSEILAAMRVLLERCKTLAEPAGAASLAALLSGKLKVTRPSKICCVVSGGNVSASKLGEFFRG